jgi:hypothetical protein
MESILIGLLGGVIGAGLAGLLQLRGARLEQLRERQIIAADEFASAATEVLVLLTTRAEALGPSAGRETEWLADLNEIAAEIRVLAHEVTRRLPRLELLFGVGRPAAGAAMETAGALLRLTAELQKADTNVDRFVEHHEAAVTAFGRFNKAAHQEMTVPAWRRLRAGT